jgi:hypothetical protein
MQRPPLLTAQTSICLFPSAVSLEFDSTDSDPRTLVGDLIERNMRLYITANDESDFYSQEPAQILWNQYSANLGSTQREKSWASAK